MSDRCVVINKSGRLTENLAPTFMRYRVGARARKAQKDSFFGWKELAVAIGSAKYSIFGHVGTIYACCMVSEAIPVRSFSRAEAKSEQCYFLGCH